MIRGLDNGLLLGDLEASNLNLLNVAFLDGTNSGLIESDDSRLSDARPILDGTVYDWAVADDAAIDQSKLDFGGDIPTNWLGTTDTTAAQGDLVERLANKDQLNGYAGLDVNGKVASGTVALSGTGRVTDIHFSMPYHFDVSETVAGTDRKLGGAWFPVQPYSYLGTLNNEIGFYAETFDISLIPNLDAAKITTGTISVDRLPQAAGVGGDHAVGLVPAPGDGTTTIGQLATDYLARDMTYRRMDISVAYQPTIPDPAITVQSIFNGIAHIHITESLKGATKFYSENNDPFQETDGEFNVPVGTKISAYAAKDGWNNSQVVSYTIIPATT